MFCQAKCSVLQGSLPCRRLSPWSRPDIFRCRTPRMRRCSMKIDTCLRHRTCKPESVHWKTGIFQACMRYSCFLRRMDSIFQLDTYGTHLCRWHPEICPLDTLCRWISLTHLDTFL